MGADREGGARRRPWRAAAYTALGVVLLAGCASMPDSGDLRDVESTPRQDTGVRVFAMPPADDATPGEIMQGFLEALTSDDPAYDTARKYLTTDAARTWRPEQSATVLANGPSIETDCRAGNREVTNSITCVLTGSRVATVDARQAYQPADGTYRKKVHLVRDAKTGQWRIDELPDGVVMGKSDFQRNYTSVDKYYFASGTSVGDAGEPVAVADPVFVRSKVDPMTQMVGSLLKGPTSWLDPVVRSSFPTGTALQKGVSGLAPDDQNRLTVPLNLKESQVSAAKCTEMATQVLLTLRNLAPTLESVELQGIGGHRLCDLTEERAESAAWHGSAKRPEYLYYVDGKRRLVRMPSGSTGTGSVPVPGVLGEGDRTLQSVAVSRDEHSVAAVDDDGASLHVTPLTSDGTLGTALVTSKGATPDERLTTPSWDARGDLWVADRDRGAPALYVVERGVAKAEKVAVPDLPGDIKDVRVAADGVRVALVVEKDGKQSLLIGRIERDDRTGEGPSVVELRSAAPDLEQVSAMTWAGDSRLLVVGQEQGGVQQMRYVQVDGATLDGPAPGALPGVKAITASEDDRVPLVAYSDDGIVRLPSGAQWQKVDKDGTAPVYPG
ncbi:MULTISPECIES: LpqB family beta-propeller domain-containing protein [Streptomyces]|uniref:Lipoprotein LpqB n=1 Tax=Streptomyces misionensis TaxID=67331 RepID=A0A1H4WQM0_9ACTN|nr:MULTISPECIES: LpqB family beta-propeller domain-containing protein [Streptomyces]SEC95632.1 Sporulation and spore germination [Streptomyces misionensis]SFY50230.1 Lipoprotein LpqB [Streptomyces sp. F-1]